jgi:hypothetical protein
MKQIFFGIFLLICLVEPYRAKDEHCIARFRNKCAICMDAYSNFDGVCVPIPIRIPNCLSYIDDRTCLHCKVGYYRTKDGVCSRIPIPDCFEAIDFDNCSVCKPGIIAVEGRCNELNKCTRRNCELCGLFGRRNVCTKCNPGYTLVTRKKSRGRKISVCIKQRTAFKNCAFLSPTNNRRCSVCEINFFWMNGRCIKSSAYFLSNTSDILSSIVLLLLSSFLLI